MVQQPNYGLAGANVLLVDDHQLLLDALIDVLKKTDIAQLWVATSTEEALAMVKTHPVDLLVADIALPGQDGFQLTRQVRRYFPKIKVALLTMHTSRSYIEEAVEAGAHGFLVKEASFSVFIKNLHSILLGELVFPKVFTDEGQPKTTLQSEPLTQREKEILTCLGAGYSNKEIARLLDMAEGTVKVHIKTVLKKLEVKNRTQAALYAYENGYNAALDTALKT